MKGHELTAERGALGQLLKLIREEKGLLQREVAERLGTPQSFVSKYESGERRIDLPELRRICLVLETSFGATPSAMSACCSVSLGEKRKPRLPGYFSTFQKSAHVMGPSDSLSPS